MGEAGADPAGEGRVVAGPAADDERGVQIVPPDDALIAEHMAAAPPADRVPRDSSRVSAADADLVAGYIERAGCLRDPEARSEISIALTPMHGVGGAVALEAVGARDLGIAERPHDLRGELLDLEGLGTALGIDVVAASVDLTRERGAVALCRNVFADLPAPPQWLTDSVGDP